MNTSTEINIAKATPEQREEIVALLQSENLPVQDLPLSLHHFFVAMQDNKLVGAIGLELYGNCGLLRSMVVSQHARNNNIATRLVETLEQYAATLKVDCMYLLTETAGQYFLRKGYETIERNNVPEQIKASSEFSHVCPSSATVMRKNI